MSISLAERISFAYLLIAVETRDAELAAAAFTGLGYDATHFEVLDQHLDGPHLGESYTVQPPRMCICVYMHACVCT